MRSSLNVITISPTHIIYVMIYFLHPQSAKFSLSNPNFYPTTNQASNQNSIFEKSIGKVSTNPDTALRWWND